jgi:hypothetical protein
MGEDEQLDDFARVLEDAWQGTQNAKKRRSLKRC